MNGPISEARGSRVVLASGHRLASLEGVAVHQRGDSIVDAAIAASAVLTVTSQQATSLGGDIFMLIHEAGATMSHGLNGSGPAPTTVKSGDYPDGMPRRGIHSVTVPGIVGGWQAAYDQFGSLPWEELFEGAIRIAEDGFDISSATARSIVQLRELLKADSGCSALYLPGGEPLAPGAGLRQPALANTLREIAAGGAAAFYGGGPAQALGRISEGLGGALRASDFADFAPEWVRPLETDYRGIGVRVLPPNSYDVLMLMQLNALEGLHSPALAGDEADRLHAMISVSGAAFAEAQSIIADPRFAAIDEDAFLGPAVTRRLGTAIRDRLGQAGDPVPGGTSTLSVADADGNGVSIVQSVFNQFGSGVLDPETGILLNNRGFGFAVESGHANEIMPGKRPANTLNPVMAFDGDRLRYVLSTPGGGNQTRFLVQVLSNLIDRGMDLASAVLAPRWNAAAGGGLAIEDGFSVPVVDELRRRGLDVRRVPAARNFGSVKGVEIVPGDGLKGVADFRREAFAAGV